MTTTREQEQPHGRSNNNIHTGDPISSSSVMNSNNYNMDDTTDSSHPNMEIRQQQRITQLDDEMEHIQMCHDSQKELLQDTLQQLRQRIHDIEQDHWKYDRVQ
jgi:hypothetical protein